MREVAEIRQVDGELRDIRERPTGCLCNRCEVFEDAFDLLLDRSVHHLHGGGIERDLAGEVNGLAGSNRL